MDSDSTNVPGKVVNMAPIDIPIQNCKSLLKIILGRDLWTRTQVKVNRMFLGTKNAGYCVCPDNISCDTIVYSIGVGEDIKFDRMMIERFGVDIFAFDPTPRAIDWLTSQDVPKKFHFNNYGIADFDGVATFNPPSNPEHVSYSMTYTAASDSPSVEAKVYRLQKIMDMLGHRKVDILKIDIEGEEFAVLKDILNSGCRVDQILVEFHPNTVANGITEMENIIRNLNDAGYKIFYISASRQEYSFICSGKDLA